MGLYAASGGHCTGVMLLGAHCADVILQCECAGLSDRGVQLQPRFREQAEYKQNMHTSLRVCRVRGAD